MQKKKARWRIFSNLSDSRFFLNVRAAIRYPTKSQRRKAYRLSKRTSGLCSLKPSTVGTKNDVGAIVARTLDREVNPCVKIPFHNGNEIAFNRIAVIAHVFYPELMPQLLRYIANIPKPIGLFVSTDSEAKRDKIVHEIKTTTFIKEFEVVIVPNRGRDIAPKLIAFNKVYESYPAFLHIHSKKSLHAGDAYSGWRDYLLYRLMGTKDIASSNLKLLSDPTVGLVYPEHAEFIRPVINWGYDFEIAKGLLRKIGVELETNHVLEFPSGSMFWARSSALKPLLDLKLDWKDFPQEEGQIDGTTAHAIERAMLFFIERAGFEWRRTTLDPIARTNGTAFYPLTTSDQDYVSLPTIPEMRRIKGSRSHLKNSRLNIIIPSVSSKNVYGGIATALRLFLELGEKSSLFLRIIVTDNHSVRDEIVDILESFEVQNIGMEYPKEKVIVICTERSINELEVAENDVFLATAWWTAINAFRLKKTQEDLFGRANKVIYLIQDFEPGFYSWSSRYSLAESTYLNHTHDTIAIFNSEELANFFLRRFYFSQHFVLPYSPNKRIAAALRNTGREKIILFYARPSAARNCFEIGAEGLALWQRRNPSLAAEWTIYCIGESFSHYMVSGIRRCIITGKMPLEDYADLLSRASVGLSLMVSPHPSYPPLEMAYAGVRTITNTYECKDLSLRSPLIANVPAVTPEHIAVALENAISEAAVDIGRKTGINHDIIDIDTGSPIYVRDTVLAAVFNPDSVKDKCYGA